MRFKISCIITVQVITAMHSCSKASCGRCGLTMQCWNNVILELNGIESESAALLVDSAPRRTVPFTA